MSHGGASASCSVPEMEVLAEQLAHDLLTGSPGGTASADQWRALRTAATSIRIAAAVIEDVLAITGNLADPGQKAMSLLPASSAAGRCAKTAAPVLMEIHTPAPRMQRGSLTACCGLCESMLYIPILKSGCSGSGGAGSGSEHGACGCLVLSFRCSQHAFMLRSTPQLAQLAAALAEVLPPALEPLRQMLATVLRQPADPAAVGSIAAESTAASLCSGALRSPRSPSACSAGSLDLDMISSGSAARGGGSGKPDLKPVSKDTHLDSRGPHKPERKGEKPQRDSRLPAAPPLHGLQARNPFWLQYGSKQQEAAFARWYALQNWQWDICMLVVCLASLVARLLRPSEHAFKIVPTASAIAAAAVLVALCTVTFCHRWYLKRRELVLMLVWGCMAHLVVMLAEVVPQWTPLWAARILALQTALCFPLTFRVLFVHALPITALKCFASLTVWSQVLGCSQHTNVAMRICTMCAQIAQELLFLVAPLLARHRLEKNMRQRFEAEQAVAAHLDAAGVPQLASR